MDELEEYLKSVMSQIGANKYIDTINQHYRATEKPLCEGLLGGLWETTK
jgi:hypothetical protein